jgi:hypothetical protein
MPGNSNISGPIKLYREKIKDDDKKIRVNNLYTELQAKEIIPVSLRLMDRKECGYGKLFTPMKNLGADVLDNIH